MSIYIICEPLASILARPTTVNSIEYGTVTSTAEILISAKKAYSFTTVYPDLPKTQNTTTTVLAAMGTSTLDIVFDDVGVDNGPSINPDHPFMVYPWFYRKILRTFTFSAPTPSPQPAISPEAALALVEKRPGVQKWLAAFGGKVGGVDPRLGHIASIGITSETASTYTIEIAEITKTLIVADGWYSVDKMTGVVTNDVSY